jgi:hypothetical protein
MIAHHGVSYLVTFWAGDLAPKLVHQPNVSFVTLFRLIIPYKIHQLLVS